MTQPQQASQNLSVAARNEISLIASLLRHAELMPSVSIKPEDFSHPLARKVFAHKALAPHLDGMGIVLDREYSKQEDDMIQSWSAMGSLIKKPAEIVKMCDKIREQSRKSYALRAGQDMLAAINEGTNVDHAMALFQKCMMRDAKTGYVHIKEAVSKTVEEILYAKKHGIDHLYVKTGLVEYDYNYLGLERGALTIIAGRPSMGKSALTMQMAKNMAKHCHVSVHTLEMSNNAIVFRMMSGELNVDMRAIKTGSINLDDKFNKMVESLSELNLYLDDTSRQSLEHISAHAYKLHAQGMLDALYVDYIGIMEKNHGREGLSEKLGMITSGLRKLAKDLNIPVVILSQLNRDLESRADKTPMLSDLKGSGDIEQDADTVLFIHRPYVFNKEANPTETQLIIAKHRNSPVGVIGLQFDGRTTSFSSNFVEGFS